MGRLLRTAGLGLPKLVGQLEVPVPSAGISENSGTKRVPHLTTGLVPEDSLLVEIPDIIEVEVHWLPARLERPVQ